MVERGGVAVHQIYPAAIAGCVVKDDVAVERGGAVVQVQPAAKAPEGCVAEYHAIANQGCGGDDVDPAASIRPRRPRVAQQAARVAAGDVQVLYRRIDVASDKEHAPSPLCVQRGEIGVGVGGRPVGEGIAAPDGDALGDINHLGNHRGAIIAGRREAAMNVGIDALCHLDDVAVVGVVHSGLDGRIGASAGADVQAGGRAGDLVLVNPGHQGLIRSNDGAAFKGVAQLRHLTLIVTRPAPRRQRDRLAMDQIAPG